jgi:peptidoglycan/LPS O-acetylase OafA/YrhL
LSFSLYLVHEPIIKAAAFTFPGSVTAQVGAIAIALGIAVLFLKVVERPIHRVARRIASRPVASPV